ncbi:hypothetical protein ACXR6G_15555 [Ancylomarina sp. YFZ004]
MKNLILTAFILVTTCFVFTSCDKDDSPDDKSIKRYNVESGIIKYSTTISGTSSYTTFTGTGTDQLYFKNWGALELANEERTETSVSTMPYTGEVITETNIIHNTVKIDNEMIYIVDYETMKIYSQENPHIEFMRLYDYDALEAGKKMLESLGGVQLDNEDFMGYDCEVWTAMGSKQWVYKGITLKIITTLAGITITKEATDIKFDVSVNTSYFELPDYEISPING